MRNSGRLVISLIAFLSVWEIVGRSGLFPAPLFPPPTKVVLAGIQLAAENRPWPGDLDWIPEPARSKLALDVSLSFERACLGWICGSFVGIAVGLITGRVPKLDAYLSPIIEMVRPLPPVAIIPIIIVWFGITEFSKLFSIALAVFFPVWVNTHAGAQKIAESYVWSARTLQAGRIEILRRVIFPGSLPFVATGLRVGVGVAFVMVYVSELAGASAGIGYEINSSYLAYRVDRMFAALCVLGAMGALADSAVSKGLGLFFPWLKFIPQK